MHTFLHMIVSVLRKEVRGQTFFCINCTVCILYLRKNEIFFAEAVSYVAQVECFDNDVGHSPFNVLIFLLKTFVTARISYIKYSESVRTLVKNLRVVYMKNVPVNFM